MTDRPTNYLSAEVLDLYRRVSTATISTQLLKRGIATAFMTGVRPLRPDLRMVGYAFTLRYIPAREDLGNATHYDNTTNPQRIAVESVRDGDVLVVDARREADAATLGDILITRMMQRGAAGVVTDGAFRDAPGVAKIDLPTYAAGSHAYMSSISHFPVDINRPIGCGGVAVLPGDLIVGDAEGVIVVPRSLANEIAQDALLQEEYEAWVLSKVQSGEPITDIYPATDASRARFERERSSAP